MMSLNPVSLRFSGLTPAIISKQLTQNFKPSQLDLSHTHNGDISKMQPNETIDALADVSTKLASLLTYLNGKTDVGHLPEWLLQDKTPVSNNHLALDLKGQLTSLQASLKERQRLLENHLIELLISSPALINIQAICKHLSQSTYTPDTKTELGRKVEESILKALST